MECTGRWLLWCPKHKIVWCLPGVCRGLEVFHAGCDVMLVQVQGTVGRDQVRRAVVSWFSLPRRHEVRESAGGGDDVEG
jgi:hypothetical protein